MPSTSSSNTGFKSAASDSASTTGGSNTNVLSPSPPIELPVGSNAIAGEDSDYSDFGQQQPSTSNSRSRQKKFLKNFKQLPQEEVVLQRKLIPSSKRLQPQLSKYYNIFNFNLHKLFWQFLQFYENNIIF